MVVERASTERVTAVSDSGQRPVAPRFVADVGGVAAVEFGLVGSMFILLMCFWIQLGLTTFMQTTLDNAVRNEARLIRTGVITAGQSSTFAAKLCADVQFLMTCSKIQYNVVAGNTFASLNSAIPINSSNQMTTTGFSPGTSGQDVLVQVDYPVPLYLPIISRFIGQNGGVFIYSSVAFQNEPF